jgi:hypothetical protein
MKKKKKGDLVKIYTKPLSKEGYEGTAKLVKKLKGIDLYNGLVLERWRVMFESDSFVCVRLIAYGEKK